VIRQDTIDRIRRETDLVALIGESLKLQKRGRSFVGLCPFHKEKSPSFHVNAERGFYHCFGCHESGDAIKFVQNLEGLDFIEAVRRVAERAGIEVELEVNDEERRRYNEARRKSDEAFDALGEAAAFFERMLREHPLAHYARAELERRRLTPGTPTDAIADALQQFRIGYAPFGWDGLSKHLRERTLSLGAAERAGLLAPRKSGTGYYDRFRHRLMFAVLDGQGRVIAFSGRALPNPDNTSLRALGLEPVPENAEPPPKYYNSPESAVYKKREALFGIYQARNAIRDADRAVIVEGNFDVLSLHAVGIKNVVAPLGTAFTVEQAQQIRRYSSEAVLLFDGDAAGRRAVRAAREVCLRVGLHARVATLPESVDPDELVRKSGPDGVRALLAASRPLLEWLIDAVLDEPFPKDDAQAAAQRAREVRGLIEAEEDPAARALGERYGERRIAERLSVADARTLQAVTPTRGTAPARPGPNAAPGASRVQPGRARSPDVREQIPLEILGAFLDFPELLTEPEADEIAALLEGDTAVALAALRQSLHQGGFQNPEVVLAKLLPSIHAFARARLAAPRHQKLDDARSELVGNLRQLKALMLSRETKSVKEELEHARRTGDSEKEFEMLGKLFEKSRKTGLKTLVSE
jgi:DNA primase